MILYYWLSCNTSIALRSMTARQVFSEKQYFRQPWLWAILISVNSLLAFALIKQIFYKQPFGGNPASNSELLMFAALVFFITLLFIFMRLETQIREDGIYYRLFPFQLKMKSISWNRISKAFIREYKPLTEYGGWGIRMGLFGSGWAVNVSGNKGLQLIYDNGKKLLIGTNEPDVLESALLQIGQFRND